MNAQYILSRRASPAPTDEEARVSLALDLSISNHLNGPNRQKAKRLCRLPLMDVALDGSEGMEIAERKARRSVW